MNKIMVKPSQRGYTLVEMAVVILIVGMAIGALFQGREMIENARITSVIQDFENIRQAHYAYIKRTGHSPGLVRSPATGEVMFDHFVAIRGYSNNNYFAELIAEGFLLDKELASQSALNEIIVQNSYGGDWSVSSSGYPYYPFDAAQLCTEDLPLRAVRAIDQKMDDGNPRTGRVRSLRFTPKAEGSYGGGWVAHRKPLLVDYTEENAPTKEDQYMACRLL